TTAGSRTGQTGFDAETRRTSARARERPPRRRRRSRPAACRRTSGSYRALLRCVVSDECCLGAAVLDAAARAEELRAVGGENLRGARGARLLVCAQQAE